MPGGRRGHAEDVAQALRQRAVLGRLDLLAKATGANGLRERDTILRAAVLVTLLNPAWGKATTKLPLGRDPCSIFIVGPGTIVSVDQLNLPFIELHYAIKYKMDDGQLIEVWTPRKSIVLLEGMHGELTYSTHPERILNFRPVRRKVTVPNGLLRNLQ